MRLLNYILEEHDGDYSILAKQIGSTRENVYQMATDRRRPGTDMAKLIHAATNRMVQLSELRPDVWG